jgi:hypothetical protein
MGLSNIIGQADFKGRIAERAAVARARGWPFPHLLIVAREGMGRYTIAKAIADEVSVPGGIIEVLAVEKPLDLSGVLSVARAGGCMLIRNLDLIDSAVIRLLTPVFERGQIEIVVGTGPGARTHCVPLPEFSFIATCRNPLTIPASVLSFFTLEELAPYSNLELARIASAQATELGFRLDDLAAACAVDSAEYTPGSINALLKRVRRYAGGSILSQADFLSILDLLGVKRQARNGGSGLLEDLRSMSGVAFEQWTANLFTKHGYTVSATRVVGDHGIDLEMEREGRRVVVQCKRWSDTVGEPAVREFYGALLNAKADSGIFVTTSAFSTQARQFVVQKPITLFDLSSLLALFLYGGSVEAGT